MDDAERIKAKVVKWLIDGNLSFDRSQDAIGTEVPFSGNRRSADLLVLSDEFHALEIKGDTDDLRKLEGQLDDYHKTFDKVSVITTPRRLNAIRKLVRPYTGLILSDGEILRVKKLARPRRRLDKYSLLMFLRRRDLQRLTVAKFNRSLGTDEIRSILADRLTIAGVREAAYSSVRRRYRQLFRLFLQDIGDNIVWDELRGLSGRISKLYT